MWNNDLEKIKLFDEKIDRFYNNLYMYIAALPPAHKTH